MNKEIQIGFLDIFWAPQTANYRNLIARSMKMYEEKMFTPDVYCKPGAAEEQLREGKTLDGDGSLKSIRKKYNV